MLSILRLAQSFHCKTALFFSSIVFAAAAQAALPLHAGTYVDTQANECQDAPNTSILTYDGHGFGGAHSSHCVSTTVKRTGDEYELSTTCSALGDGTPVKPQKFKEKIHILSPERFSMQFSEGTQTYKLCPDFK
ncbi:hypothetical protein [Burkholderia gladioli]|uniref:hypothetical protein n=1 Tax=Burkholderia gladioli TaxID=28095 RepID=UPI0013F5CF5D|nr:hypothetical protein [Burkholderia gladioli]NHH80192.1 hypothetical protein [Burkholderia gladioli]